MSLQKFLNRILFAIGMEREKQEIYPSEKKIMGMDFFCIKHNIPDGEGLS